MPNAEAGGGTVDPAGLGAAVAQLSGSGRRAGHGAFLVLGAALGASEQVEVVVPCRFLGTAGCVALTDQRLVLVTAREWRPDVLTIRLEPGLEVQGWQDERTAALVFSAGTEELVVDQIGERAAAQQLAASVRARVG